MEIRMCCSGSFTSHKSAAFGFGLHRGFLVGRIRLPLRIRSGDPFLRRRSLHSMFKRAKEPVTKNGMPLQCIV